MLVFMVRRGSAIGLFYRFTVLLRNLRSHDCQIIFFFFFALSPEAEKMISHSVVFDTVIFNKITVEFPHVSETGPGASKNGKYKNPEYFCYHPTSYFDAEIEMLKFRLPQPSAKTN